MEREGVRDRIEGMRAAVEKQMREYRDTNYPSLAEHPLHVVIEYGRRYARIVREDGGRSAAGFVDLTTGGILYAGSWKGPQDRRPRGDVFAPDFGLSCFGRYAVATLR